MLKEKLPKLIEAWQTDGVRLAPPNSERQIADVFDSIGHRLSADVSEFYQICGGMINYDMDESLLSMWSLVEIEKENSNVSELTFFADYLIDSHRYAFKYENENVSSVYSDGESAEYIKIADSLESFFDLYLINPSAIYLY